MTYQEAARILATRKRKVANNTVLIHNPSDNSIGIQLHGTQVVVLYPDGSFSLYTGGWNTVTTRARINAFAPVPIGLHNKKRMPYIGFYGNEAPFYDGMTFDQSGRHIGRITTPSPEMRAMLQSLVCAN